MASTGSKEEGKAPAEVRFDYIKGQFFRVVFADGVYGGGTPRGHFHLAFFNERTAIPQQVTQKLDPKTHELGTEIPEKMVTRGSVVRELEVDVMMTLETAKVVAAWMQTHIKMFEDQLKAQGK